MQLSRYGASVHCMQHIVTYYDIFLELSRFRVMAHLHHQVEEFHHAVSGCQLDPSGGDVFALVASNMSSVCCSTMEHSSSNSVIHLRHQNQCYLHVKFQVIKTNEFEFFLCLSICYLLYMFIHVTSVSTVNVVHISVISYHPHNFLEIPIFGYVNFVGWIDG